MYGLPLRSYSTCLAGFVAIVSLAFGDPLRAAPLAPGSAPLIAAPSSDLPIDLERSNISTGQYLQDTPLIPSFLPQPPANQPPRSTLLVNNSSGSSSTNDVLVVPSPQSVGTGLLGLGFVALIFRFRRLRRRLLT